MNHQLSTILIAYGLDLIIGDPKWQAHPVRIIGRLIENLEARLNIDRYSKVFSGILLVMLVVGSASFCVWLVLKIAKFIHPVFYLVISILLIYFAISIKELGVEAARVYEALNNGDIKVARKNLSMIVGRDTENLDEPEIIRATVETVAESIMDGIIAPLFYTFLGGAVLAWSYKAINTLDSMVGYRSQRFIEFGRFSARLDSLVNFIPAKLTCILISISGLGYRKDWFNATRWISRYFLKTSHYNSESTEAAMAAVLGVQLGGLNFYNGVPVSKPFIGDNIYPLNPGHIKKSIRIAYISSGLFLIVGIFFHLLIYSMEFQKHRLAQMKSSQISTDFLL